MRSKKGTLTRYSPPWRARGRVAVGPVWKSHVVRPDSCNFNLSIGAVNGMDAWKSIDIAIAVIMLPCRIAFWFIMVVLRTLLSIKS